MHLTIAMTPVQWLLLGIAAVFLLGAVGELLFRRTGIPDVLWLVLAGVLLGPVGGVVGREDLARLAPPVAAITLVVILFQGGVTIKWRDLVHTAPRSGLIAVLGFALTMLAIIGVSSLAIVLGLAPAGWTWLHGAMLGAILGGSSSIIIMPAMAHAGVRTELADVLKVESALTDILCVVVTATLVDVLLGRAHGGADTAFLLLRSFGIAIGIGVVAGLAWVTLMRLLALGEHAYPVTLAALLALYVAIDHAHGNPALGIFTVAVVLGNTSDLEQRLGIPNPRGLDATVRGVHVQVTFIIKSFFFVFLGAMLGPPWSLAALGVALAVLLLATRIPAVWLGTVHSTLSTRDRWIAGVSLPRGLAAGVMATVPVSAGVHAAGEIPVLVFSAVIASVILFAVAFPIARGRRTVAPSPPAPPDEAEPGPGGQPAPASEPAPA